MIKPDLDSTEAYIILDEYAWEYMDKVRKFLAQYSDQELLEYAGVEVTKYSSKDTLKFSLFLKEEAYREVTMRAMFKQAEPFLTALGSSGAYCVYHACDMKDCGDKHE
jgi:hypothetical protein